MNKKILVIDRDNFLISIFKAKFEELDMDFTEARNAKDGLSIIQNEKIDLLISEVLISGMSGTDMIREIKKNYPNLPIIIFSELGQGSDIEEVRSLGITDYFVKSKSTVDQVVERSKKILK